jgi:hypothetical protein
MHIPWHKKEASDPRPLPKAPTYALNKIQSPRIFHVWSPNLTINHSIVIYVKCRCRWTPHLPHLGKNQGSYAYLNIRSPGSHSLGTVDRGHEKEASDPRPHFQTSVHTQKQAKCLIHTSYTLIHKTSSGLGWEASDPRAHTQSNLRTPNQP